MAAHRRALGQLDRELALSNDEEGEEDVAVVPALPLSMTADGELGDEEPVLVLMVLSAAFSTDK